MSAHHRLSRALLCLTVGVANAAWISPAFANPEYRVTIVGPANSGATDINKYGVVTGDQYLADYSPRGFLNRGKGIVFLGTMGGVSSNAIAINDKGQVLAQRTSASGVVRGFIYQAGTRRDIASIPGKNTRFTDINYGGYITAIASIPDAAYDARGYLLAPDGKLTDIGNLPYENPMTYASALNNHNDVAGASGPLTFPDQPLRAIVWSKGAMRDLGDFGLAPNYGTAINQCGQITGSMSVVGSFRNRIAYIYNNGRLTDIDGRPSTADRYSAGAGINSQGHVVGSSDHLSGYVYRGRRMQSLNALIDPKLHWDIQYPAAINDAGQIAATAVRNGVQYAVRLDLIRPMLEAVPEMAKADGATALAEEEDARANSQAAALEVAQPAPK